MIISRLRSTYHVARNFERSLAFYQEVLGLPLKFRDGNQWAEFQLGETRFALSSVTEAAEGYSKGAVSVFQSSSLEGISDKVSRFGGLWVGTRDMGSHGHLATIRDPEGTIFQVIVFDQR